MSFDEILLNHVTPVVAMACMAMFIIGVIKIFTTMLIKEKNEKLKKVFSNLYIVISIVVSVGLSCGYFALIVNHFDWLMVVKYTAETYACTQALYPIYRDYGGRFLLLKFLSLFKHKDKNLDNIIDSIEKVLVLTENQKDLIKKELGE